MADLVAEWDFPAQIIASSEKPMRERVDALQAVLSTMPQVEPVTLHYFADGMYAREVARDAGVLVVGKVHKREHFYIVTKGKVQVTVDDGVKVITAPAVIVSKPGTKRAVLALEDSVCMTVHRTDNTDLDSIERELVEDDPTALFNSSNRLKELT